MENKSNRILKTINTCGICMLSSSKQVLIKYTWLWLWRWLLTMPPLTLVKKIMNYFVMWKHFYVSCCFSHLTKLSCDFCMMSILMTWEVSLCITFAMVHFIKLDACLWRHFSILKNKKRNLKVSKFVMGSFCSKICQTTTNWTYFFFLYTLPQFWN